MDELLIELRKYYGSNAEFREGQAEAIQGILQGKRTLVVQKTGWGKSLVYFLATKILRKRENRITLIISPLLALMNNQIDSAVKLELNVKTINSENVDQWEEIVDEMAVNAVDALIISPERLANDQFQNMMLNELAGRIGLFVVDEAHCISDWGHDFRPDYRRIVNVVNNLPHNIPVLATTATANNRVVEDIKMQLGASLKTKSVKSTSVTVSAGGREASTSVVSHDGERNDRSMGAEVITFMGVECDSVGKFISENTDRDIKLTFNGASSYSMTLPSKEAREIALAYDYAATIRRFKVASLEKERLSRTVDIARSQASRTFVEKDSTK